MGRTLRGTLSLMVAAGVTLVVLGGTSTASSAQRAPRATPASLGTLTTYDWGNARYGFDAGVPHVGSLSTNPRWDMSLDGAVYGQPLVDDGVVYVATENDSVYSLNAKTGAIRWRVHVGNAVPLSTVDTAPTLGGGCGDIDPLGITGTPVIDTHKNELFAAEETLVGGSHWQNIRHWLVAVSLTSHRELWHRSIDPPDANQANHYYIPAEQQRPAATILDGRVYVEYGGLDGDCGAYHGYVVGVSEAPTGGYVSYQVPTQREGGIWGTAGAVAPPAGDLYVATGNGSSSSLAHFDEGNSIVELSPTLHRLGYWAPSDWVNLNDEDWDLGSASPVAVPGTSLLFAAGKPADAGNVGYLMRDGHLGGIGKGAFHSDVCPGGGAFGADATYVSGSGPSAPTYVYVPCGSGTEALRVHTSSPISFQEAWAPSTGSPNGPPIVAGGWVWALDWNGNQLYAMNPLTGRVGFIRGTDGLNHFATPGFGDGMVVVPTGGGVEAFAASS